MSAFRLRFFRPEDLLEVVSINLKTLPENYSPIFFLSLHRSYPKTFLVAEVDGRIVGYIMCRIESWPLQPSKRGHVVSIAVLPEYRRRGIGTALMEEAMRNMVTEYGAQDCYLEVRVSNEPAIRLYKKLGFEVACRVPGYYADGEDAYIMTKRLQG